MDEADPNDIAGLKQTAKACQSSFQRLSQEEESREDDIKAEEGYWASQRYADFNLWCVKVGVDGEGLRSIDVRLKDVPGICGIILMLLEWLQRDLDELRQPAEDVAQTFSTDEDDGADGSDTSSLSFDSLSSDEHVETQGPPDESASAWKKRNLALRNQIGDTIERLHGLARLIERASAAHRRKRIEVYRQKEGPKATYEGLKQLALRKASIRFVSASDVFQDRLAESFARRRIRFDYLKAHQKKRAVGAIMKQSDTPLDHLDHLPEPGSGHDAVSVATTQQQISASTNAPAGQQIQNQHTIHSGTVETKLQFQSLAARTERAETVASVALRHSEFPPPPRVSGDTFMCPYCRLEFRAREAEKDRWSRHVMQDFEPYFCLWEGCKSPFDVPNSFDGLLVHLKSHTEERYHVDMPNGDHKELDEREFEEHFGSHGGLSRDMLAAMKDSSRRHAVFLFDNCPFCGGYPDDVERQFEEPHAPEAQNALRIHIKKHMQDVALFLPPYRDDISDDSDAQSSAMVDRRSVGQIDVGDPSDFKLTCDRVGCECESFGYVLSSDVLPTVNPRPDEDMSHAWAEVFSGSHRYARQPVTDEYYLGEGGLQPFVQRFILGSISLSTDKLDQLQASISEDGSKGTPEGITRFFREKWPSTFPIRDTIWSPPLHTAVYNGDSELIQLLLERGAYIDARDGIGQTSLHLAAKEGHPDVVRLLLVRGADIEAKARADETSLHLAAKEGHTGVVRLLLIRGGNIEAKTRTRKTSLHLATENGHADIVQLLVDHDPDLEAKDIVGQTPLHLAVENGHSDIVQLLLHHNPDLKVKDITSQTSLHLAAKNGRADIVQLLLGHDPDLETKDMMGQTSLHLAIENGHANVVALLLDLNPDLNAKDVTGRTPLHRAAEDGRAFIVQMLLRNQADIWATTEHGKTPLDLATSKKHTDTVQLLINNGAGFKETQPPQYLGQLHDFSGSREAISWIKSFTSFSVFIKNACESQRKEKPVAPVRMAILDHCLNQAHSNPVSSPLVGISDLCNVYLCNPIGSTESSMGGWFGSLGQHATKSIKFIRIHCPDAKLFIPELDTLSGSIESDDHFVAESAPQAVNSAVKSGADIIIMNWEIQETSPISVGMKAFHKAIKLAASQNIILLCFGGNREGASTETSYPGDWWQCIRIGAASPIRKSMFYDADFFFPCTDSFTYGASEDCKDRDQRTITMATAAALAATLIYSARLLNGNDDVTFQSRHAIMKAFNGMSSRERFVDAAENLGARFKRKVSEQDEESSDIRSLPWNDKTRKALDSFLRELRD